MHIRGQALNEQIYQYIIVISGSLGFLYGAYMEDFGYCVYAWFGGCCLACLICIPEWSFFNRDPEKWLDPAVLDAAAAKKSKKPKSKSKKSKDKKKA